MSDMICDDAHKDAEDDEQTETETHWGSEDGRTRYALTRQNLSNYKHTAKQQPFSLSMREYNDLIVISSTRQREHVLNQRLTQL